MDPRLLRYYNQELQFMREMGAEFAQEFPKIAARLGVEGLECADPYVERLLEGFAFLAARVQLKIDQRFPRFTHHLLETVYPHYLAPTPAMAVVHFQPNLKEGSLADGVVIPRDSGLRSILVKGQQTPCEFRTAHDVTLWPLELVEAQYVPTTATLATMGVVPGFGAKAGIRLRLRATAGLNFAKLALDRLPLFLQGSESLPMRIYEQLLANGMGLLTRPAQASEQWSGQLRRGDIRGMGFDDQAALLPTGGQAFSGYRLLHEYFAFPARFMFVELCGLAPAVCACDHNEFEVMVLLDRSDTSLSQVLDAQRFGLFCSPAINLFPKRADRIHLSDKDTQHHVVPDRSRPLDFEVYSVDEVVGFGTDGEQQTFRSLYSSADPLMRGGDTRYYTVGREPRVLSSRQRRNGTRSSYIGHEAYISLVDLQDAPYRSGLRQLAVQTHCTNRDLPLLMPVGRGDTDFSLDAAAPVSSVRCVAGPTPPRPTWMSGDAVWRLISHLSLNYLSLVDNDQVNGCSALRELLSVYAEIAEPAVRKQIEGLRSVSSRAVVQRLPVAGPIVFGRGVEVSVTCDEDAFEGSGVFLMGAVLEEFLAKYVSINSFTQAVLMTPTRGEIMRWPPRTGQRQAL